VVVQIETLIAEGSVENIKVPVRCFSSNLEKSPTLPSLQEKKERILTKTKTKPLTTIAEICCSIMTLCAEYSMIPSYHTFGLGRYEVGSAAMGVFSRSFFPLYPYFGSAARFSSCSKNPN
jgi:hypothetical protein